MESFRNKQFISFKLCAILTCVMKSPAVRSILPGMRIIPLPSCPCCECSLPLSHLVALGVIGLAAVVWKYLCSVTFVLLGLGRGCESAVELRGPDALWLGLDPGLANSESSRYTHVSNKY